MEASTREFLRGLLKTSIHSNNMLKGLLSVFRNIEVSFFIIVFPDFGTAEECVLVLGLDRGNSSLF